MPDKGETYDKLAKHMAKWGKGKGFNANPLGELNEMIRWLCQRLDGEKAEKKEKGRRST